VIIALYNALQGQAQRFWSKKRVAVAASTTKLLSRVSFVSKTESTRQVISAAIKDNLLFQDMPQEAVTLIIDSMKSVTLPADMDIITQVGGYAASF
jgi:hypothetical protein